jgi:hypothetical protein
MATRAYAWFETLYVKGATHVLQSEGYLTKGLFAAATGMNGKEVTWKIAGRGDATEMSTNIEVRPTLNGARTTVVSQIKAYEANEDINVTDLNQMSEAEIQVAQQTCGYAIGRKFDQIPFQAMDAAAGTITTIGDGTGAISPVNLLAGQAAIRAGGIQGNPMVNVALTFNQMATLLTYKAISSADYCDDSPLLKAIGARVWLGMRLIPMPDEYLAVTSGQASAKDGYMWLGNAMGFHTPTDGEGKIKMATRIDYIPREKCYHAANTFMAAAKPILPEGIRRLSYLNTAPSSLSNL